MDAQQWNERYASEEPCSPPTRPGSSAGRWPAWSPAGPSTWGAAKAAMPCGWPSGGWHVTGVDFSDVGLAKARRRAGARGIPDGMLDLVPADLAGYDPERDAFDLVLILFVHPPQPERRRLLAAAAGALVAGGTLLVVGYDVTNPTRGGAGGRRGSGCRCRGRRARRSPSTPSSGPGVGG